MTTTEATTPGPTPPSHWTGECATHGRDCDPPVFATEVADGPFYSHAAAYLLCNLVPARIVLNLEPGFDDLEGEVRMTAAEARDLATTLLLLARNSEHGPEQYAPGYCRCGELEHDLPSGT